MRGSPQPPFCAPSRATAVLAPPPVLCGRLRRVRCALARRAAPYGQGGDARHRAGQRPPAALAGAVPATLHRRLESAAYGGRQHRPVRPLRWKQQDRRPHSYDSLKPSVRLPRPSPCVGRASFADCRFERVMYESGKVLLIALSAAVAALLVVRVSEAEITPPRIIKPAVWAGIGTD